MKIDWGIKNAIIILDTTFMNLEKVEQANGDWITRASNLGVAKM